MATNLGLFDTELRGESWFDPDLLSASWFSPSLLVTAETTFPVPVLTNITPDTIVAGSGDVFMVLTGADFVAESVARWNAEEFVPSFFSATELHFTIPADHVAVSTSAFISVLTPAPGGGISAAHLFIVTPALPPPPPSPLDPAGTAAAALAAAAATMRTVADELDRIQTRLHDDGTLWPRAELLRAWQDGYRELLIRTLGTRRWRAVELPPRHSYAISQEWEDRYTSGGTVRACTRAAVGRRVMLTWEAEHLGSVTPSAQRAGVTHLWELAHTLTDRHYRIGLPRAHQRLLQVRWNDRRLSPLVVRELDELDDDWFVRAGEPRWWTGGAGRVPSVEVYEITSLDAPAWAQIGLYGLPRHFETGAGRTYAVTQTPNPPSWGWAYTTRGEAHAMENVVWRTWLPGGGLRITIAATTSAFLGWFGTQPWEADFLDGVPLRAGVVQPTVAWEHLHGAAWVVLGLGTIRQMVSPDRQYYAHAYDVQTDGLMGRVTRWSGSQGALSLLEVVGPDVTIDETVVPQLIPRPLLKYVRYYVWARAFGRPGEGHSSILADHYGRRFARGVTALARFHDVAHRDHVYIRGAAASAPVRPARVSLPPEFPAVLR